MPRRGHAHLRAVQHARNSDVGDVFREWDGKGSGVIRKSELLKVLRLLGLELNPDAFDRHLAGTKWESEQCVDYREFLSWIYSQEAEAEAPVPAAGSAVTEAPRPTCLSEDIADRDVAPPAAVGRPLRLMTAGSLMPESTAASLRIIHVTDVYSLENFPSLKTFVALKRAEAASWGAETVSVLTGDFLAPYLLASLDKGRGMMRMINETPIDYLTWGNHDGNDCPHKAVMEREREYRGVWVNSNMTSHESFEGSKCQTDKAVIEICSPDGSNRRMVGMVAVLSNSPDLYRPGAFGGATIEDPWETLRAFKARLQGKVDLLIPLCHLYEHQDERTCREFDFPLVLSGHDHHCVDRTIDGTRLLKPGADLHHAIVIDITWNSAEDASPRITADTVKVTDFEPDVEMTAAVHKAYAVLEKLRATQIVEVSRSLRPLTSLGSRRRHVTMGTFLCSHIRDALNMHCPKGRPHCDCVIMKGANVRGGRDYAEDEHFTLESLLSETQEEHVILIFEVPGWCLRVGLRETWGGPGPGWMQYSDDIALDPGGSNLVTRVAGAPLDESRIYRVGSIKDFSRASDGPTIGQYLSADPRRIPDFEAGMPTRALLLGFFADRIWLKIWDALDRDHDGVITREEFAALDKDGSGELDRAELMAVLRSVSGYEVHPGETSFVDEILRVAGDADGDKLLSLAEINRARRERVKSL